VHWPKQIPQGGGIQATPGHVIDFVPTILDLAGVERPGEKVEFPGRSLRPTFSKSSAGKRTLWWSHKGNYAIRDGDWKLVKTNEGKWELYHISEDRAETANLADQYPERVEELTRKWEAQVEQIRQVRKLK
jgi:arylsulfatase